MPTKLGVLGFAHGHINSLTTQWQQRPELALQTVAGWDHDAQRLQQATNRLGIRPCETPADLLADDEIDAVAIAAETNRHAELVEQAAAAGKAILCYKPMALTMAEADRMVAAVNEHGVRFSMGWQMRCDPQNLKMKELVDSGAVGRVFMVRRRHGLSMCLNPEFASSWHVAPESNRDIFADDASHAIDFLHWLLGVPESVTAELDTQCNPAMPNDTGLAIFRYADGPLAVVSSCFASPAAENTTEIIGEKGSIIQNYGDGPSCNIQRPKGATPLKWFLTEDSQWHYSDLEAPEQHGHRIANQAEPLAAFLRGDGPPVATVEEGRTSLRMLLACYVSTREGRRVKLDDSAIDAVA